MLLVGHIVALRDYISYNDGTHFNFYYNTVSGNNTFEMEPLNLSQRAPTPSVLNSNASGTSGTSGTGGGVYGGSSSDGVYRGDSVYGSGAEGSVHGGSVISTTSSRIAKPALVTRIRTTPATTNPTNPISITGTTTKGQLTLQVLEHDLANLSIVDAPAR